MGLRFRKSINLGPLRINLSKSGVGFSLKETEGWAMILPTCNTNGKEGYFPMKEAYDEGGYEARSSNFKAGIAELICEEGKKILAEMAE